MMSALAGVKLIAAKSPAKLSPLMQRRGKLIARIGEQMELARAVMEGREANLTRTMRRKDAESGETVTVRAARKVRGWWWELESGRLALAIKYGNRALELAKGKFAVEIASVAEVEGVLRVVSSAVKAGELDAAIEAANAETKTRKQRGAQQK